MSTIQRTEYTNNNLTVRACTASPTGGDDGPTIVSFENDGGGQFNFDSMLLYAHGDLECEMLIQCMRRAAEMLEEQRAWKRAQQENK